MEFAYPAIFHPSESGNIAIVFPDLPGCFSQGKDVANAVYMAQSGLKQWLEYLTDKGLEIPVPSAPQAVHPQEPGEYVTLVRAELRDAHAVRRNVSLPAWMNDEVNKKGISLSRVLQDALVTQLAS
jgi:predicted RNase H-like HicB family nuclease